jgi:four helix bundle protein
LLAARFSLFARAARFSLLAMHLAGIGLQPFGMGYGSYASCRKFFAMSDFKKLRVWREAHKLTLTTIRACEDVSGSVGTIVRNQWVRSTMSVPANVAEGSAKRSDREFARFVRIALGSATEAENHMILAYDLGLIQQEQYEDIDRQMQDVQKMLAGLERKLTSDASLVERKPARSAKREARAKSEQRAARNEKR